MTRPMDAHLSADRIAPDGVVGVSVQVRNTGGRPGQTVVQLYVHDVESALERPWKELKAFGKVSLQPGETQTVTLPLDMRSLAYFDDRRRAWVADAGEFELLIGQSSADLPIRQTLRLESESGCRWCQDPRSTPTRRSQIWPRPNRTLA